MAVQHFVNPDQLVQAVSCAEETHKNHVTLTFDLLSWYSTGFQRLSRCMFMQNFIKLSTAVHELSRSQRSKKTQWGVQHGSHQQPCLPAGSLVIRERLRSYFNDYIVSVIIRRFNCVLRPPELLTFT